MEKTTLEIDGHIANDIFTPMSENNSINLVKDKKLNLLLLMNSHNLTLHHLAILRTIMITGPCSCVDVLDMRIHNHQEVVYRSVIQRNILRNLIGLQKRNFVESVDGITVKQNSKYYSNKFKLTKPGRQIVNELFNM